MAFLEAGVKERLLNLRFEFFSLKIIQTILGGPRFLSLDSRKNQNAYPVNCIASKDGQ